MKKSKSKGIVPFEFQFKQEKSLKSLINSVASAIRHARHHVNANINYTMTWVYWGIGRHIVEFERHGKRALYGQSLLKTVAKQLIGEFGRGYSWRNLYMMCKFYESFQDSKILQTLSAKLAWSKFCEVIRVEDPKKRNFYIQHAVSEDWDTRELRRQINSGLYERTSPSKRDKKLGSKSIKYEPSDIIKDPYIFEFLGLADKSYTEKDLEKALIDRLQEFLVELGKGFCFEARQKRIDLAGTNYYVDLVFYHRILKTTILIDLKIGEFKHEYAGQMNYYLNWWKDNEMAQNDQSPIGIILCADKNEAYIRYALGEIKNPIFVSRYKTELPTKTELQHLLMDTQEMWEREHKKISNKEIKQINKSEQ